MEIFVKALLGKEQPIGKVFISYSRDDEKPVHNSIIQAFRHANIPYFIDTQDVGVSKIVSTVRDLIDDSSCGVIALSETSAESSWVNYETGVLEGMGKRIFPFSLVSGSAKSAFLKNLPDYYRQYNVVDDVQDLLKAVRDETFIAGKLLSNTQLRDDIFSELKEVNVDFTFHSIPKEIWSRIQFGYLLVKFGHFQNISQISDEAVKRDGTLLNQPLYSYRRENDAVSDRVKIHFRIPIHKILGTQLKFFVDVEPGMSIEKVEEYLEKEGLENISSSTSAETQRLYFLVSNTAMERFSFDKEGITNNFIYPS